MESASAKSPRNAFYALPLTPTMEKLVEACQCVDQLIEQKLRDERLAEAKAMESMHPFERVIRGLHRRKITNAP